MPHSHSSEKTDLNRRDCDNFKVPRPYGIEGQSEKTDLNRRDCDIPAAVRGGSRAFLSEKTDLNRRDCDAFQMRRRDAILFE